MLLLLLLFLPLVLAAIASYIRCLAQREWQQLLFVDGPLYGSMVAAFVVGAFGFYCLYFPSVGQGPGPLGMSDPSATTWGILTGIYYAIVGVFIGLAAATLVLKTRHLGSRAIGSTKSL